MFLQAPHHIAPYKNVIDCRLLPESVIMGWQTWLETVLFYLENLAKFKELISNLEDDTQSVKKIKIILNTIS